MTSLVNLDIGLETGLMHDYRRFVEREMSKRQWNANQVAQHAGLQRQTVYDIVQDTREVLPRPPAKKTIDGLSQAFGVSREKILAAVAVSMGLPVQIVRADVSTATNDELMNELSRRLSEKAGDGNVDRDPAPMNHAEGNSASNVAPFVADKKRQRENHTPHPELLAAYEAGETELQRQDRESENRDSGSQDPDDYR